MSTRVMSWPMKKGLCICNMYSMYIGKGQRYEEMVADVLAHEEGALRVQGCVYGRMHARNSQHSGTL